MIVSRGLPTWLLRMINNILQTDLIDLSQVGRIHKFVADFIIPLRQHNLKFHGIPWNFVQTQSFMEFNETSNFPEQVTLNPVELFLILYIYRLRYRNEYFEHFAVSEYGPRPAIMVNMYNVLYNLMKYYLIIVIFHELADDWVICMAISKLITYSISQEICTRLLLCCALLWLYIDWFSHIHQAYFTGTVAI